MRTTMRRGLRWTLGLMFFLLFLASSQVLFAKSPKAPLFPTAECQVSEEMEHSRESLQKRFDLIRIQGVWPWPDITGRFNVNGIWLNSIRGTYMVVQQVKHADSPNYGALYVRFYSACTHELLAHGTRVLHPRDWDSPAVNVSLRNIGLNGNRLIANIKVLPNEGASKHDALEVRVWESRVGTRDHFFVGRFE